MSTSKPACAAVFVTVIAAALTWSATTLAGAVWRSPVDVSSGSVDVDVPRLAVDPAGDAFAVWYQSIGIHDAIMSATRPAGSSWSAPVEVASGSDAYGPQVGIDAHGGATVVWYQYNGSEDVVEASTRPPGGSWSAPQQLSASLVTGGDADQPAVAVDAAGDAVVVWYQFTGAQHVVTAASRPAGGAWSAPVQVSAAGGDAYEPQVSIGAGGLATADWYRYMSGSTAGIVQTATLAPGGSWSAPQDLSGPADDSSEPQIASDESGDATAVWASNNGASNVIEAARRPAGGTWSGAQPLSSGGADADAPQVAVDSHGTATAVWASFDGSNFVVQTAAAAAGARWSAPTALSAPSSDAGEPQVSADAAGNVAATWSRFSGLGDVIEAALRPAGGGWSAAEQLSGGDAYQPQIALSAPDRAVAIWQLSTGGSYVIQSGTTTASAAQGGGSPGGTPGRGQSGAGAPRITELRIRPAAFRLRTGATVSYRDSAAAATRFSVLAVPPRSCTRAQRRRRQCVIRGRVVGWFVHHDRAGANRFRFSGRLGRRTLAPGLYRLVASPRDGAGRVGAARVVEFRMMA